MSLNTTPVANRLHIGIFGCRNVGKSSVLNAITGQEIAVVSNQKGTTTDPVYKTMELLPLGAVVLIDTPGMDDEGTLGALRVQKSIQALNKTDLALLVLDGEVGYTAFDLQLVQQFDERKIPFLVVVNKAETNDAMLSGYTAKNEILVSAKTGLNVEELKNRMSKMVQTEEQQYPIISDLINAGDMVVLVVPVDSSAPKGRLILPQQQTIREVIDANATALICQDTVLKTTLNSLGKKPKLVVTDSQVFATVNAQVPSDIPLTSFSILFARHKGDLALAVQGAAVVEQLKDGDAVLIAEGCTHHRQCDDIGTVKLPKWLTASTGKQLVFSFTHGTEFPQDVSKFALVVHCGGCMLNEREMKHRLANAKQQGVPITNYGILIAHLNGILERCVAPLSL